MTSSNRPARFRLVDHDLLEVGLRSGQAVDARAVGDVLEDRLGEGIGLLEHHADAGAQLHDVEAGVVDVLAVDLDLAGHAALGMVSFMRLMQRRKVDLPQPDGPMKAITPLLGDVDSHVLQRLLVAVEDIDVAGHDLGRLAGLVPRRPHLSRDTALHGHLHATAFLVRPYQRRSKRWRSQIAMPFMTNRNSSSTMIAAAVFALEGGLGQVRPQVDLHRQDGRRLGEGLAARRR